MYRCRIVKRLPGLTGPTAAAVRADRGGRCVVRACCGSFAARGKLCTVGRDRGGEDAALPHRGQLEVRLLTRRILTGRDQRTEARGASGARRALSRPARCHPYPILKAAAEKDEAAKGGLYGAKMYRSATSYG